MAGHNKWSKIKRQKAKEDKRKSKVWARLTREIEVAAREGGGDPEMNPTLSQAIEKAKEENMPKDNIESAIKRGTGELEEEGNFEFMTYEGYAPNGVAVYVEALTDNRNRTAADVRHVFDKQGGSLGQAGSVDYLFERKGILKIPVNGHDELELFELAVDAGAEDAERNGDEYVVTTAFTAFKDVEEVFDEAGFEEFEAHLERIPKSTVSLEEEEGAEKVVQLVEELYDLDDVQAVFTTLERNGKLVRAVDTDDDSS